MSELKKPRLGFLFMIANNLAEIRHFYTEVIGLSENSYFEDEQFGWLSYHMGDLEMDWFRADTPRRYLPNGLANLATQVERGR